MAETEHGGFSLPKVTKLVNGRTQGLNPGHLSLQPAFLTSIPAWSFTRRLAGVHRVSCAQMWRGPNTHRLPNIEKCGSNQVYKETTWVILYKGAILALRAQQTWTPLQEWVGKEEEGRDLSANESLPKPAHPVALTTAWGVQWVHLFVLA